MNRKFNSGVSVSFIWDKPVVEQLEELARRESLKQKRNIRACDLIREAVTKKYALAATPAVGQGETSHRPHRRAKRKSRRQMPQVEGSDETARKQEGEGK